jgi:hypothetical protein
MQQQRAKSFWAGALLFAGLPLLALTTAAKPKSTSQDLSDTKRVPIYLSDFELSAATTSRPTQKKASGAPTNPTNLIYADTDPAPVQARRLVDALAVMLTEAFQKQGYTAMRQDGSSSGVLLRGVFAEADSRNRIRRAILGAGAPGTKFILYIGAFNLGHEDQPLYLPAAVQSTDAGYGPVITMNAYIPMVKFEVPKNPTDEDVRKVCAQIVNQLTQLLVRNPNAVSQ